MKLAKKIGFIGILSYIFFLILFSSLFYFENESLGSTKISQIWKIPLVVMIVTYIMLKAKKRNNAFIQVSYIYALKNLLNLGLVENFINNATIAIKFLNFPLLLHFFIHFFKSTSKAYLVLIRIAQYFILSSLPFHLGLVSSYTEGLEFGDKLSYIGIFQNPHGASTTTAISVLILIFYIKNTQLTRIVWWYNILLMGLGVFSVYLAFVRTGYAILVVGALVVLWPQRVTFKQMMSLSLFVMIIIMTSVYLINTNDAFRARLFDLNESGEQRDLGSGRIVFMKSGIEFWAGGGFFELLVGRGYDALMDNNKESLGMRIFSHNGFVDSLSVNGVLGLVLYLYMIYCFYKLVASSRNLQYYRLGVVMLVSYVLFQAIQGGPGFQHELLISLSLSILIIEKRQMESKNRTPI